MSDNSVKARAKSPRAQVKAFLRAAANARAGNPPAPNGRLVFAMDATASRQPAWQQAGRIQRRMFEEAATFGGLDIQLCYFRGHREFVAGPWLSDAKALSKHMSAVTCAGGRTQLEQVLSHTARETAQAKVNALVFVGDAMEENSDRIFAAAGALGRAQVPAFLFQEGTNPAARRAFAEIARLTGGAWAPFDAASAQALRDLLSAVAVYAAGGQDALESRGAREGGAAQRLAHQLRLGHKSR